MSVTVYKSQSLSHSYFSLSLFLSVCLSVSAYWSICLPEGLSVCLSLPLYIYIYIEREREREKERLS